MKKESWIVIGVLLGIVVVLGVIRFATTGDGSKKSEAPTAAQTNAGQIAIEELARSAVAEFGGEYIASVTACHPDVGYREACLTVSDQWSAKDGAARKEMATRVWQKWADICTSRQIAGSRDNCLITLRTASGSVVGGSDAKSGSNVWVAQ